MINSHCTATRASYDGAYTYQGSNTWGKELLDPIDHSCFFWNNPCRNADAALIEALVPIELGRIARTTSSAGCEDCLQPLTIDHTNPFIQIRSKGDDTYENETLQKIGQTSGWTYGNVEDTCADNLVNGMVFECTDRVDFSMHDGDSGSPVFYLRGDGAAELRGIAYGTIDGPYNDALISDMHQVQLDLGELIVYDPGPMAIAITGPTEVAQGQTCAWTATITGGLKPISGQWSGVLSESVGGALGDGASIQISGTVTSSGYLYLNLTDYYGRTASSSFYVLINPNAQNNCYY